MRLPKTITIFGQVYTIKLVLNLDSVGLCDFDNSIIYIRANQAPEQLFLTLLHEINHAIQFRTGLYQALSREVQEVISENFSVAYREIFEIKIKKAKRAKS